jgi:hypothetical protein
MVYRIKNKGSTANWDVAEEVNKYKLKWKQPTGQNGMKISIHM